MPNSPLPTWSPKEGVLWHVGSMSPADKGSDSLEGHGLSVSECPDDWEAIARLGGAPRWELVRADGLPGSFLDMHRLKEAHRSEIFAWGIACGLCTPVDALELSFTDSEAGGRRTMLFIDQAVAAAEFEAMQEESADSSPALRQVCAHALSPRALAALRRQRADPLEAPDLLAVLWAEQTTDLDGVYWDDLHAPELLSAPRAVIFPGRLGWWLATPLTDEDGSRLKERMTSQAG